MSIVLPIEMPLCRHSVMLHVPVVLDVTPDARGLPGLRLSLDREQAALALRVHVRTCPIAQRQR